jgi:hypothetical protein
MYTFGRGLHGCVTRQRARLYLKNRLLKSSFAHTSTQDVLYMPCAKRITLRLLRDHERRVQLAEVSKAGPGSPNFS